MKPFYEGGRLPTQDQIPALLDIKRTAESQGTISTIAFAAGAVALGAGTFLWLTDSPAASPEPAKVSVQVAFTPASGMVIIHFP
jgi:peptidyl-tRNA hydrolase